MASLWSVLEKLMVSVLFLLDKCHCSLWANTDIALRWKVKVTSYYLCFSDSGATYGSTQSPVQITAASRLLYVTCGCPHGFIPATGTFWLLLLHTLLSSSHPFYAGYKQLTQWCYIDSSLPKASFFTKELPNGNSQQLYNTFMPSKENKVSIM